MNPHALKVVIVSQNTNILRETSWILTAYGYEVQSYRAFSALATTWRASQPNFLLVDSDHPEISMISQFPSVGNDCYTYKVLLHDMSLFAAHVEEWKTYFNDVISKPVNCGELLSRLQAGSRYLDFERTTREQEYCDQSTGLLTKSGLLRTLNQSDSASEEDAAGSVSMVFLKVNYVESLTQQVGKPGIEKLLREVADFAADAVEDQAWVARTAEDVFAFAFLNLSLDDSTALVENIRQQLGARQFEVQGNSLQLTTTVYARFFDTRAHLTSDLFDETEENLNFVSMLGGTVVAHDDLGEKHYPLWVEKHIQWGEALSHLTASDVMTPFTAKVSSATLREGMPASIRHSQAECVPFFDDQDFYTGVLDREAIESTEQSSLAELLRSPHEISESTSYAELTDLFTNHDEPFFVVLRDETPLGYVTADSMAELLQTVES